MRRDSLENKQRILDVFAETLRQDPTVLPSMTDIVKNSGLGRGTVYRHFSHPGDLLYAHFEGEFTKLYATYEPEWIQGGSAAVREQFETFLLRCADFSIENKTHLATPEFYASEGRRLAQAELRRKIFVTATILSEEPLKPIELSKWADAIAYCVEIDHLSAVSSREVMPDLSVRIAMTLMEKAITP